MAREREKEEKAALFNVRAEVSFCALLKDDINPFPGFVIY